MSLLFASLACVFVALVIVVGKWGRIHGSRAVQFQDHDWPSA
jgi:hypothetical protein